ncbi:hypothetical protein [Sphingomonas sp. MMS24-J13]|uniref:hypothetical protein n=1 Tax=Sphingomonas sp. MMS24-J13 TaxID=3238686 RepID=UPI00384B34DD
MPREIQDEPSEIAAEEGAVIVDGPDGVAVTLTAEAAAETGNRLQDSAAEARGQRDMKALRDEPAPDRPA